MILESLIVDGSKLTLDCAKATLGKGSKVEISDEFYQKSEVQNAIRLGLIRLVGDPPPAPPAAIANAEEARKNFRSAWTSKLTFDCIKDYVDPGGIIRIPESKLTNSEVQNAIAWGMLVDADAPAGAAPQARRPAPPVEIDELKVAEALGGEAALKPPKMARPAPAVKSAVKSAVKAKKISKTDEAEDGDGEDLTQDPLYKPSEVHVPKEDSPLKPKARPAPEPIEVEADEPEPKPKASRFDFLEDIFEDEPRGGG